MPVKKAKSPTASIRYLLSADPKFRKLSLKKISERAKKTTPRLGLPRKPEPMTIGRHAAWTLSPQATLLVVGCVAAAAVAIAARQQSPRDQAATEDAAITASALHVGKDATGPPTLKTPAVERKKEAPEKASILHLGATEAPVKAALSESAPAARGAGIGSVTITGCLAFDNERFWLKDPSGAGAPKQRSWRSGFLRKRPQPIELVNGANSLRLSNYVGQRVAATGTLINSDMHADALTRVSGACE